MNTTIRYIFPAITARLMLVISYLPFAASITSLTTYSSIRSALSAFEGGAEEYNRYQRCVSCRGRIEVVPDYKKFENAKIIELKNLNTPGKITAVTANSTLSMERLIVFVAGKHTLSVGFGEEVEIVGDLYVLGSDLLLSRFGGASRGSHAADSGRAQPILYAKRMKYTKRERELNLTDQDSKAIKKFASLPNLIPRLTSIMSPG